MVYFGFCCAHLFSDFAHSTNPNKGPLPVNTNWPLFNADTFQTLQFVAPPMPLPVDIALFSDYCDFWDDVGYYW